MKRSILINAYDDGQPIHIDQLQLKHGDCGLLKVISCPLSQYINLKCAGCETILRLASEEAKNLIIEAIVADPAKRAYISAWENENDEVAIYTVFVGD